MTEMIQTLPRDARALIFREGISVDCDGALTYLSDRATARRFLVHSSERDALFLLRAGTTRDALGAALARIAPGVPAEDYIALYDDLLLLAPAPQDLSATLRARMDEARHAALRDAVDRAVRETLFYKRRIGDAARVLVEGPILERFAAEVPRLTRSDWRAAFPTQFLPAGETLAMRLSQEGVRLFRTSGTTGDQLITLHNTGYLDRIFKSTYLHENIFERRHAIFGPLHCMSLSCGTAIPPFSERYDGFALTVALADPMRCSPAEAARIAEDLAIAQPEVLVADPHYLASFLLALERQDPMPSSLSRVYLGYNFVQRTTRAWLAARLDTKPHDIFGMTECGFQIMRSCSYGGVHLNEQYFHFEFEPWNAEVDRLIVTAIGDIELPLLRFESTDLFLHNAHSFCACGSPLRLAGDFAGRVRDAFHLGGRSVTLGSFDRALGAISGMVFYQLDLAQGVLLRYRGTADPARVTERLAEALAALGVSAEPVAAEAVRGFHWSASGKFEAVVGRHGSGTA
ncbi:hypothetical protein Q2941_48300 [Bradyrhizobium sp. UFLA05-153]